MRPTTQELNNKIWYRAGKVIFIGIYVLSLFFFFAAVYSEMDNQTKWVRCDSGKEFKEIGYPDDLDNTLRCSDYNEQFAKFLKEARNRGATDFDILNEIKKSNNGKVNFKTFYVADYNFFQKIIWGFLTFVIVSLVFGFIARVIRYILTGEKLINKN